MKTWGEHKYYFVSICNIKKIILNIKEFIHFVLTHLGLVKFSLTQKSVYGC